MRYIKAKLIIFIKIIIDYFYQDIIVLYIYILPNNSLLIFYDMKEKTFIDYI